MAASCKIHHGQTQWRTKGEIRFEVNNAALTKGLKRKHKVRKDKSFQLPRSMKRGINTKTIRARHKCEI